MHRMFNAAVPITPTCVKHRISRGTSQAYKGTGKLRPRELESSSQGDKGWGDWVNAVERPCPNTPRPR